MHEDNSCIRYLMKEMDPSEEILMERAMMEDEDLLIEVESMRQTLKKLDKLPQIDPPSHIQDAVMQKASEHAQKKRSEKSFSTPQFMKYAVAATIALTFTAGGSWLFMNSTGVENENISSQTAETSSLNTYMGEVSSGSADLHLSGTNYNFLQASAVNGGDIDKKKSTDTEVEPWVDRNNILRFEDQGNRAANFEAILEQATQKLRPMEGSVGDQPRINSYQLTGSGN